MSELIYSMEEKGDKPLYEYLYTCIRDDVLTGKLPGGLRLPSRRQMAEQNGISQVTVDNAYAQLCLEGYIEARPRSGYYVTDMSHSEFNFHSLHATVQQGQKTIIESKAGGPPANTAKVGAVKERAAKAKEKVLDLTGNHASRFFPYATWARISRRVLCDYENEFMSSVPAKGAECLREEIADYLRRARGLEVTPERIVVGPGTEYLHHLLVLLLGRSYFVGVEDPGYSKVGKIYESNGLKVIRIPVDKNGMRTEELYDSNVRLVHVSPAHHFPTGCVMSASRRTKLIGWANEQNAYVIEDDYDSEFRFRGRPLPPLALLDSNRVIYMNTFTKTLTPNIRIAYMVLPERLTELFDDRMTFLSSSVGAFEQYTLAVFMREGYYERHLARMRTLYGKARGDFLRVLKESELSGLIDLEEDSAGLHFEIIVKPRIDSALFIKLLEDMRVKIAPLGLYCINVGLSLSNHFIIHYSVVAEAELRRAFAAIAEAIRKSTEE